MKPRSPVRVEKRTLALGIKSLRWVCDDRFRSAEFQSRRDPNRVVIVHRSTKQPGRWQTSWFDAQGATGDAQSDSCTLALRELSPTQWRLRAVTPKR